MAFNRREKLITVFEDTINQIAVNPILAKATKAGISNTRYYAPDDYPSFECEESCMGEITVTRHSTFEAAQKLNVAYPPKKIAVLNFASAINPGGGVKHGSSAQEEALCRCSTLFPTLNQNRMWQQYYLVNREEKSVLHTDACIYSPDVIVFKSSESIPKNLPTQEWFNVDVITCAAPNLRNDVNNLYNTESGNAQIISNGDLYKLQLQRAKHILCVAAANKANILVLGAFGCGAFRNDPRIVAQAFFDALKDYIKCFDLVEFAIYCRDYETENYQAFLDTYERIILF